MNYDDDNRTPARKCSKNAVHTQKALSNASGSEMDLNKHQGTGSGFEYSLETFSRSKGDIQQLDSFSDSDLDDAVYVPFEY